MFGLSKAFRTPSSPPRRSYLQNAAMQLPISQFVNRWYGKVATRIYSYSLSNAIVYALARFYSIRVMVRTGRRVSRSTDTTLQPVSDLIVGPPLEEVLKKIRSDGWCPGISLKGNTVHELLKYMDSQKYICRSLSSETQFRLQHRERLESRCGASICFVKCTDPYGSQIVQSIANDQMLRSLATRYFGYPPRKVDVQLLVSFATNTTVAERLAQKQTIFYHYDLDDFHTLYFSFYLSPVDEESGAHVLIPGTHGAKSVSQLFRTLNFSDHEIEERRPKMQPMTICGNPGDGFVEDPFCFHKALPPKSRHRYVLQLRFM